MKWEQTAHPHPALRQELLLQHKHTDSCTQLKQLNSTVSYDPCIPSTAQRSEQKLGKFVTEKVEMDPNGHLQFICNSASLA